MPAHARNGLPPRAQRFTSAGGDGSMRAPARASAVPRDWAKWMMARREFGGNRPGVIFWMCEGRRLCDSSLFFDFCDDDILRVIRIFVFENRSERALNAILMEDDKNC